MSHELQITVARVRVGPGQKRELAHYHKLKTDETKSQVSTPIEEGPTDEPSEGELRSTSTHPAAHTQTDRRRRPSTRSRSLERVSRRSNFFRVNKSSNFFVKCFLSILKKDCIQSELEGLLQGDTRDHGGRDTCALRQRGCEPHCGGYVVQTSS